MDGMSCSASAQKAGSFGGTGSSGESLNESRQIHIIEFPAEVLENILRYLPFGTVGKNRLVCRWFNSVCSSILNAEFQHLRILMQQRFQSIKAQMPRRESARRKHPLARESDIIETLHMRLTLLQMSFGKHIERKHCCFFAGEILDEVYKILRYVKTTPNLSRAYKVTDELFDLSTMAMEYFKEHIEPTLPEITYFAADFLDYTPSFSSSPKTQLSLMEGASNAACTSAKTLGGLQAHISEEQPSVKKRIKRLRDNIKRNNNHILVLRRELKLTRQRATAQQKQIIELKARCGDYDKKFQSTSRKLSAILQELSRCTTELQYWRSKSPAVQCTCGKVTPVAELKEVDAAAASIDKEAVPPIVNGFQFDGGHTFKEEFKPINADVTSCSSATEVLLVPSCHSTPADKVGTANLNLPLIMPGAVEGDTPSSSNDMSELKDGQELKPKACKRKLSMDSSINDVQIAKQTLVPMDVNM